ncbi:MAG: TVP38/TMEM64 family protein [Planctomycetes bacterium]|nr:TVP38/TMEM64 family protein [Planctomycetota bacterium]
MIKKTGGSGTKFRKVIVALVLIAAFVAAAKYFDIQQMFRQTLTWISDLGSIAPLIFILLYILACVLLLPGSILTLGAGVVFGVIKGSIAVSVGSTLGATAAFLVGRYLACHWVSGKVADNEEFKAVDEAVAQEGWKIVLLTRLSPVFPFNLLNYAFGLSHVSLKHYMLASWLGMIPGTIMYVYIGSLAGDLASLGTEGRTRTTGEWILYGIGLLATGVVTVFVTRLAKKALASRIPFEKEVK